MLPPHGRRSSLRRKKKDTAAAKTDQLITDFNQGKEVDLDTLTAHPGGVVPNCSKPMKNSNVVSARANVRSWLQSQKDADGGGVMLKWPVVGNVKHHSVDIHHL